MAITNPGQDNLAGDVRALNLKMQAEVLTTFLEITRFGGGKLTNLRKIKGAGSAKFPVIGTATAKYLTQGTDAVADQIATSQVLIEVDEIRAADVEVGILEASLTEYDVRAPYNEAMAQALQVAYDVDVYSEMIKGARAATPYVTGGKLGTIINIAGYAAMTTTEKGIALASAIFDMRVALTNNNVSAQGRKLDVRPEQYAVLAQNVDLINKEIGGIGAIADGTILRVAGIEIYEGTTVPNSDGTAETFHGVDASNTLGVGFTKDSVGTVDALSLKVESEYFTKRSATYYKASLAVGHKFLRPETCVEITFS